MRIFGIKFPGIGDVINFVTDHAVSYVFNTTYEGGMIYKFIDFFSGSDSNNNDKYTDGSGNHPVNFTGTPGGDLIVGSKGADTIHGGLGEDKIFAGKGNDIVYGGTGENSPDDGDDFIDGGEGNDLLYGNGGNDILLGDAGNDTLYGGNGNDKLSGGADRDVLIGGPGADTFIFTNFSDSQNNVNHDVIMDFCQAEHDKIDLSQIDAIYVTKQNEAFHDIGYDYQNASIGLRAGELAAYHQNGSTFIVMADHDYNSSTSLIELRGFTGHLTDSDFIF